jgi:streptogramin lyase
MFFRGPVRDSRRVIEALVIIALMLLSGTGSIRSVLAQKGSVSSSTARVTALSPIAALTLAEWTVPSGSAVPWGIGLDSSGKIWFTENASGKLGRFDPTSNNFTEWSIPEGGSPRYVFVSEINMTRVCFTEYSSNRIGFLSTSNNTFIRWQLAAGSNPVDIFVDETNDIWFTESGRDVIGRLRPSTGQLTEWTLPGATSTPSSPLLRPWGLYVRVPPRSQQWTSYHLGPQRPRCNTRHPIRTDGPDRGFSEQRDLLKHLRQ